jgi:hypothetical protein
MAVPFVERVLIDYEPSMPAFNCYAFPRAILDGILNQHFDEAPYFALIKFRRSDGEIEK